MQFKQALRHNLFWKVINTFLTFFINLLLVRLLGSAQSGSFYYDITVLGLMVLIQGFSLEAGIVYWGSKNKNDISVIAVALLLWLLLQAGLSLFVLNFLKLSISLSAALMFVMGNIGVTCFTALFSASKSFSTPNIILAAINFIIVVVLFFLYCKTDFVTNDSIITNPIIIYIAGFVLQALGIIIFFFKNVFLKTPLLTINVEIIKKLFAYSALAFVANLLFFLLTRIDYYFVSKYCTAEAIGNYIQVSKLGQFFVLLPSVAAAVLFPFAADKEKSGYYLANTQFYCKIITWFFILLILMIGIIGFWLFPFLFGSEFDLMYKAMLFYLPGFFALCITTILAAYTAAKGMVSANVAASAMGLLIVIAGDILLIPLLGINGAAIASSIAYCFCMIYLLLRLKKTEQFLLTDFFKLSFSDLKKLSSLS